MTTRSRTHTAGDALAGYMEEIRRYPLLGRSEEIRLARLAGVGDPAARRRLVESNLRLVVAIARRYRSHGLDLMDLVQEGNLGLMAAVERYDRPHELRFGAFAAWWIRRAITRALSTKSRLVRVPIRLAEQMSAVRRVEEDLMQRLGRPPTTAELARETGIDEPVIDDLRRAGRVPTSLSEPLGADDDATLADLIPDHAQPDPAVQAEAADRLALVADALGALDERPRRVIELRFGVDGRDPRTLDEVAGELGVSRERARTIEATALRRLSASAELEPIGSAA